MEFNWDDYPGEDESKSFNWDSFEKSEEPQDQAPKVSVTESALRGAVQGLPFVGSYADEAAGVAGAAKDYITGATDMDNITQAYQRNRDLSREAYKAAKEANPIAYNASVFGASLPLDAAKMVPGLGQAVGAVEGGIYSLGASEADLLAGDYDQAALDTAIGAGTGAILPKVIGAAGKGIVKGARSLGESAQSLSKPLSDIAETNMTRSLGARS